MTRATPRKGARASVPRPITLYRCFRCGHETRHRDGFCGPCRLVPPKPVGWWDDLPDVLRKIGAVPLEATK